MSKQMEKKIEKIIHKDKPTFIAFVDIENFNKVNWRITFNM